MKNKKKHNPVILYDGRKAIDVWNSDDGFTIHSGDGADKTDGERYMGLVPVLFRAVNLRARSVANMPFALVDSAGNDYDTSQDWQNKVDFLPNPYAFFYMAEASLCMAGNAYFLRQANIAGFGKQPRYLLPHSIRVDDKQLETGNIIFERTEGTRKKQFTPDDIIYLWALDPTVEYGPAKNCAVGVASSACGVLYNVDEFAEAFFARGAIKSMLLTVTGNPPQGEREKLETWWNRTIAGIRNAWGSKVINADNVKPVIIGEGMKELENVSLTDEKRHDVALSFDIPFTILFADAANYATSQQDKVNLYEDAIIPECKFIAQVLNEQVFEELGLRLVFRHETLDIMQKDEGARAQAGAQLAQWIINPEAEIIFDVLGYELDEEQLAKLKKIWAAKEAASQAALDRLNNPPAQQTQPGQPQDEQPPQDQQAQAQEPPAKQVDLNKWMRKALKHVGQPTPFESANIPPEVAEEISLGLPGCKTAEDVKRLFAQADGIIVPNDAALVLEGLRLAVEFEKAQKG